jgi:hypothetical protein
MNPLGSTLFVSTFGWNPGDNFIQLGVERILTAVGASARSSLLYNKAPHVSTPWRPIQVWRRPRGTGAWALLHGILDSVHYDNSWKRGQTLEGVDAVVFSGSPGWFGPRLRELYRLLEGYAGPVMFLGIGTPNRRVKLSRCERFVLERALVVTRDRQLQETLQAEYGIEARCMPCPALFSAPVRTDSPPSDGPVGFVFSARHSVRNQAVSARAYESQHQVLEALRSSGNVELVCHYIDDWDTATRTYGRFMPIHYHFDPHHLIESYRRFSYVVSTRVHGCGVASSLSIPNALIGTDRRAITVEGFKSRLLDASDVTAIPDQIRADLAEGVAIARQLSRHRSEAAATYEALVSGRTSLQGN